jgi:hypothetical protein
LKHCQRCKPPPSLTSLSLSLARTHSSFCDEKVANRNVRDFGWEIAHAAVSRPSPVPLSTSVARTEGYTYASKVWALSIVQGPFSVAPCQTLTSRFATFPSLYVSELPLSPCAHFSQGRCAQNEQCDVCYTQQLFSSAVPTLLRHISGFDYLTDKVSGSMAGVPAEMVHTLTISLHNNTYN